MIHPNSPNSMWNTAWWTGSNSCAILGAKKEVPSAKKFSHTNWSCLFHSMPSLTGGATWGLVWAYLSIDRHEELCRSFVFGSLWRKNMQWIKDVISTSVIQCLKSNLFDIEKVVQLMISDECCCKKRRTLCAAFASCTPSDFYVSHVTELVAAPLSDWISKNKQSCNKIIHQPLRNLATMIC